jgi:hypothetical protein
MQPPLISPPDRLIDAEHMQRLPSSWREAYLNRPLQDLPRDVNHLYDLLWSQRREIDLKAKALLMLQAEQERDRRFLLVNFIATVLLFLALGTTLIKLFWLR